MSAAGIARARVAESVGSHPRSEDIGLVVSELVTNAIEHGEPPVMLQLQVLDGTIRITVSDEGGGQPVLREQAIDVVGGRGLALLGMLASRWDWVRHGKRLTVWAEFDSDTDAAPPH